MAQQRGFIRQARAPKRLTQWGQGPGGTGAISFSASSASLLGAAVTFGAAGTVVRIRGALSANLISYTNSSDGFHCAAAIGLVSLAAFTAGIASVPTPITEAAFDGWLWHKFFFVHGGLAAGATAVGVQSALQIEIDTKAMRKVSDEMAIFGVMEVVESGTAVMEVHFNNRLLLKLG